jgi:hypothetical protein
MSATAVTPHRPAAPDAAAAAALLRRTATVRERAGALLARAREGRSECFELDEAALEAAAAQVAAVTRRRYPELRIPYHSRWRHFEPGGVARLAWIDEALCAGGAAPDAAERARAHIDLVVVSVLLDAGAGPRWIWREARTGLALGRSEGLGLASLHAFLAGRFSSDPAIPARCDAAALAALQPQALAEAFQVGPDNPLVGLEGRAALLRRLGQALRARPEVFGPLGRPGALFDHLCAEGRGSVAAHDILALLLDTLSGIWPAGNRVGEIALGDCWPHPAVRGPGASDGWMPFHKLSQWLSYSLLEPFEWAGVSVTGLDALTGLPEYRNGGLLLDHGVLRLRDPAQAARRHAPGSPLIVEWRALTVALLDALAPRVLARLGPAAAGLPLACVLEGGTWAAGREMARDLRDGSPPLDIDSDGTVF